MALTNAQIKEILSQAGVDAEHMSEAVRKILDGHTTSIEALREERDKYKAEAEKSATLQQELDKATERLKSYAGKDYDALEKEYHDFKVDVEKKSTRAKKEDVYKRCMKDAGIPERHYEKIIKYSNVDDVQLDDEGNCTNLDTIMKSLKDDWGDHREQSSTSGAPSSNPPTTVKGGKVLSKDEIMKIEDTTERQEAWGVYLAAQQQQKG